jgi:hypothetical protein
MRVRWKVVLPFCGLVLFAVVTYRSIVENRALVHNDGRYFFWSGLRLDSDPLKQHSESLGDPLDVWVDPGCVTRCLIISALPAFLVSAAAVQGLAKLGISEVLTFMVFAPLLILAWFYFFGWILDRLARRTD